MKRDRIRHRMPSDGKTVPTKKWNLNFIRPLFLTICIQGIERRVK